RTALPQWARVFYPRSLAVVGQSERIDHANVAPLHGDQSGIDQPMEDAREGFRLDPQLRGDQAFRYAEPDLSIAARLFLAEEAHHPAAGIGHGQGVDFGEPLVQADAEAGQQFQADARLLFEQAAIVGAVDAYQ